MLKNFFKNSRARKFTKKNSKPEKRQNGPAISGEKNFSAKI